MKNLRDYNFKKHKKTCRTKMVNVVNMIPAKHQDVGIDTASKNALNT